MSSALVRAESYGEEIANCLTHGTGAFLAVAGLALLAVTAASRGNARAIVGCSVFGAALVILYATSTLYHALRHARAKEVLRVLDHSAIFLLIAGTYTPFTLVSLRGAWGWSLFGIVWGLALVGVTLRLVLRRRPTVVFMTLYLSMGWCVLVALHPLAHVLAPSGMVLLVAGGVAYSAGVVFYLWRRLRFHHAIWHGFVLLGSVLHYLAILLNVAR
jgi:hemolysin III